MNRPYHFTCDACGWRDWYLGHSAFDAWIAAADDGWTEMDRGRYLCPDCAEVGVEDSAAEEGVE